MPGVAGGRLRALLELRAADPPAGQGGEPAMTTPGSTEAGWVHEALRFHDEQEHARRGSPQPLPGQVRDELVLERIDRARRRRPRVREDRITMSHGAAGKATQTPIGAILLSCV